MKTLASLTALILIGFTGIAHAQSREQQVYNIYATPQNIAPAAGEAQIAAEREMLEAERRGTRRIYPGRELYGRDFGYIPRHPGDYRDAVDRGAWSGGGSGQRSFSVE